MVRDDGGGWRGRRETNPLRAASLSVRFAYPNEIPPFPYPGSLRSGFMRV
jgi:hypothetical protein